MTSEEKLQLIGRHKVRQRADGRYEIYWAYERALLTNMAAYEVFNEAAYSELFRQWRERGSGSLFGFHRWRYQEKAYLLRTRDAAVKTLAEMRAAVAALNGLIEAENGSK